MKTYNIIEIFKFKDGTKFKISNTGEIVVVETVRVVRRLASVSALTYFLYDYYINASYELVEEWEEVEFMEAMEAYYKNNKIKCEYVSEFIFSCNGEQLIDLEDDGLLVNLILNGKWFIKK